MDLAYSRVSEASVVALAERCRKLERLDLCHTGGVSDAAVSSIAANCADLRILRLSHCGRRVTDASVSSLGRCHKRVL